MKYRKKPVEIEAIQWTGVNLDEVKKFLGDDFLGLVAERRMDGESSIVIRTLEGQHVAKKTDMIIRGVKGEHYACDLEVFQLTYEHADVE